MFKPELADADDDEADDDPNLYKRVTDEVSFCRHLFNSREPFISFEMSFMSWINFYPVTAVFQLTCKILKSSEIPLRVCKSEENLFTNLTR